ESIGHNERLVARAITSWGGDASTITVATKGGLRREGDPWPTDGRAKHLARASEPSTAAPGVTAIRIYFLHPPAPKTPLRASVRALVALLERGLVRGIGLSNVNVEQIETAVSIAPIAAVQVKHAALGNDAVRSGVVAACRAHRIQLFSHTPLGGPKGL